MEVQAKNIRSLLCARFTFKSEGLIIVAMKNGLVAQLGERTVRIRKAEGSIPFESTKGTVLHPTDGGLLLLVWFWLNTQSNSCIRQSNTLSYGFLFDDML